MEFFASLNQFADFMLLILRFGLGVIFLVHGLGKRGMWKMEPDEQTGKGMLGLMRFFSIAEPLGAIAMIAGFLTQIVAICFSIIMMGAIYMKMTKWGRKFSGEGGWEFEFMVLVGSIVIIALGAGAFGLDRIFFGI